MSSNNLSSSIISASLSHYVAEKEKALAELEVCLKSPAVSDNGSIVDKVILLFKKLNDAQSTIELISGIIEENQKGKINILEQLDKAKERLEKPTPPLSQIITEEENPNT